MRRRHALDEEEEEMDEEKTEIKKEKRVRSGRWSRKMTHLRTEAN